MTLGIRFECSGGEVGCDGDDDDSRAASGGK